MKKLIILLFSIGQVLNATTYYVAKTGNDRNNGINSPFLTIQRGVNFLRAGDTLYVRAGVYSERVIVADHNGTADNPIVITAFPNERPIIDGANLDLGGDGNGLVSIFSAYVRLNGFEIRNADMTGLYKSNMAVYLNGNNILSNCVVHNAFHGGVQICGNNNLMEFCTVYDCSMYNSDMRIKDGNSAGVSIRGFPSRSITANYNTIRNCTIYDVYGETVSAVYTKYTVMEDNVVYQGGIYICNSQNGLYQRNFVYIFKDMGEFRHVAIGCDNEYSGNTNSDNSIINNICYGAWSNFFSTSLINCTIANNTFVNSRYDWGVIIYRGFTHSNSLFVNNIIIQEGSAPCIFYDGSGGITFSNNLWNKAPVSNLEGGYSRGTGDVISTSSITKSGVYTSPDYYRLFQGSPAIDAGRNLVSTDFEGNSRYNSDIGAFEFSSGTPSPGSPVYLGSVIENSSPTRLEMTYNMSLASIVPSVSAFTVTVNTTPRSVTSVSISGPKVILTLSSPVSHGNTVTVAYTKPSSNPLQTPSGGQAATIGASAVKNNVAAVSVPVLVSSVIENSSPSRLEMTYNMSLASIVPSVSAFTVTVNTTPRSVTSVSISGPKVILTLSSPVSHGNIVTVAYTKPSSNPLQTPSGGQAASFSARSSVNNVSPVNTAPVISVSSPRTSYSGFINEINASKSYDSDKDKLSFIWTAPSSVHISETTGPVIRFLGPIVTEPARIEFSLRISDGKTITPPEVLTVDILPYRPELEMAEISGINASKYYSHHYPVNINDGNSQTMWSVDGYDEFLTVKLKQSFEIHYITLSFNHNQKTVAYFDLLGSSDSITWEPILNKSASCGFSGDFQAFNLPPSKAGKEFNYLRIIGQGNSENSWNYISELKIYGYRHKGSADYEKLPVKLYPNPARERVTVKIEDDTFNPDFVKISDLSGSMMYIANLDPAFREFDIPLDLKDGMYILHLGSGNLTVFAQKLIVRKK